MVSAQRTATQGRMPVRERALCVHLAPRCPGIPRLVSEYAVIRVEAMFSLCGLWLTFKSVFRAVAAQGSEISPSAH